MTGQCQPLLVLAISDWIGTDAVIRLITDGVIADVVIADAVIADAVVAYAVVLTEPSVTHH